MKTTSFSEPHAEQPGHAPRSREAGFTLGELVVGVLAAIVALGSVIGATVQISRTRQLDEQVNLAYLTALSTIEELRLLPAGDLPAQDGVDFDVPGINGQPSGLASLADDDDSLVGEIGVSVDQSGGGATLYRVTVAVDWEGPTGAQHFQLDSLMGERTVK